MTEQKTPAGFWIRAFALTLDTLCFGQMGSILVGIVSANVEEFTAGVYFATTIALLVISYIIYAVLESSPWQGTVGKKILGLVVTDDARKRISILRAFARQCSKLFSTFSLGIGFLMVGVQKEKKGLHDIIAGTRVWWAMPLRKSMIRGIIGIAILSIFYFAVGELPIAKTGNQTIADFAERYKQSLTK